MYKLREHYPLSRFLNYIKSQQDISNDSYLQGSPAYDVYGLTKNDVVEYLCKKTKILLDAENLYASEGTHVSSRTYLLFGICFVLAFICGLIAWPDEGENANGIFALLSIILFVLPLGIKVLHKKCFIRKHNNKIYNVKIEKYLDALSSYIDYISQKTHYNWDKFIIQETRYYIQLKESENESLWEVVETRRFTPAEIECVKACRMVTTCGSRAVFVELINDEKCFIRCYGDFNLPDGAVINLEKVLIVVLSNNKGEKIMKISCYFVKSDE